MRLIRNHLRENPLSILVSAIPLAILADWLHWGPAWIFLFAALGLVFGVWYLFDLNVAKRFVMPFNEPTSGNGELANGNAKEVAEIVRAIGLRLRTEGFADVKLVVPCEETVARSLSVAETILADEQARPFVGAIGIRHVQGDLADGAEAARRRLTARHHQPRSAACG